MSDVAVDWLFQGEALQLTRYRCRRAGPGRSADNVERHYVITIPRGGVFVRHTRGRDVIADVNHALFFNAGEPYQTSHPFGCGDHGVCLVLPERRVREILRDVDRCAADCESDRIFTFDIAPLDSSLFRDAHLLLQVLARGGCAAEIEEFGLMLAGRLIAAGSRAARSGRRVRAGSRAETGRAHAEQARVAQGILASRYAEPLTIARLADAACVSPFHLCRIFRAMVGVTIHQYLTRARVKAAFERVIADPAPLAIIALDCGFSSQSHLTTAFRAAFGITPGALQSHLRG